MTWRALAAVTFGTAGVAVGIGTAGIRIVKLGPSWGDVPGLIGVTTGVVLLVWGTVSLVRRARPRRRLIAIPVGLLWLYYVMLPLTVAVYATHPAPTQVGSRTPADLGQPYREVSMMTDDGVRLAGWYLPSSNGAAVLALHGSGETRSSVLEHGVRLAEPRVRCAGPRCQGPRPERR